MKKYLVRLTLGQPIKDDGQFEFYMMLTHKEKRMIYNTIELVNILIETVHPYKYYININFVEVG